MVALMEMTTDRPGARIAMPRRRFQLLDAMILVAATAIGCGWTRWISRASDGDVSWSYLLELWGSVGPRLAHEDGPDAGRALAYFLVHSSVLLAALTLPIIASWTLALIPIRLLGPRPGLRRLARQPGMTAACASGLAIGFAGLLVVVAALASGYDPSDWLMAEDFVVLVPVFIGLAVGASWMTLLAGRRWRAEPGWVDRLGRAFGVFWIVAGFAITGLWFYDYSQGSCCQFTARQVSPR